MKYLFCISAFLLTAVSVSYGDDAPVKIGVLAPLTGATAGTYGVQNQQGVLLAKETYERTKGHARVTLVFEDSKCEQLSAITAAKKLIEQDRVELIIGDVCWTDLFSPLAEANRIPVLSTGSAQSTVRDAGDYIFRLKVDVSVDSRELARVLREERELTTAAVISVADSWGGGIAENFADEFTRRGGKIVSEFTFQGSGVDVRSPLAKMKQINPAVIVIAAYPAQTGVIARQIRELGISSRLAGYRGGIGKETLELGRTAVEGMLFIEEFNTSRESPVLTEFISRFRARFGDEPGLFAATGYDAFMLFVSAIESCGRSTGCIKSWLYNEPAYTGVSGSRLSFDEKGDVRKELVPFIINGGEFLPYQRSE